MAQAKTDIEKKITTSRFIEMAHEGKKIAMLTSYDYTMARLVDKAGVDAILVGDSASNVMEGNKYTVPITVDDMIVFARSVARAVRHALVVCDMPFGSYQVCRDDAVRNAVRIMKETGVDALKIEGGEEFADTIKAIINAGIPVMGHLGLTPQSVNKFGGYGLRAKEQREADKLLRDAHVLEGIGCFGITLEKIPAELARRVTSEIDIPTIGIGAGSDTDGQVLVVADMLGMDHSFSPKFLRRYADLETAITDAVGRYVADVKAKSFPSEAEQY